MDDLERRLRDANPFAAAPLPPAAQHALDDIVAGRRTPRMPAIRLVRRRIAPVLIAASSFVVVALVVVAVVVLRPQVAVAATPRPLALRPVSTTVESLYADLERAAPVTTPSSSQRGATWQGWYAQLDADHPAATFIQPQTTTITWQPDLSGSSKIVAGDAMDVDGTVVAPPPTADTPGTVLSELTMAPGEFATPFTDTPPEDEAGMRAYLDAYLGQGLTTVPAFTAADYVEAVVYVMQTWTLDDAAQRAAIAVVLSAPGVVIAGTTTDRADREGIVLQMQPSATDPGHRAQLVIDPISWRLLAVEHQAVDGFPEFRIPPGAVMDYTLWQ